MDFLRDTIWQSIGAIISIVALFVTIILFRAQNQRKKLSYEIIANSTLIGESAKNDLRNKIQITYDGKPIQNTGLVVFKIYNSGNVAILSSEFETPIEIFFNENSEVLNANVIATKPTKLKPIVEIKRNQISIKPLLLNVNDEITIKALINNYSMGISFTGRIAGVKEIELYADSSFLSSLPRLLFTIYFLGGVAGAQAAVFLAAISSPYGWEVPTIGASLFNLSFGLICTFLDLGVIIYVFRKAKQSLS